MAGSLDTLPPLRDVVAAHGLAAKKSLGQNFIFDLNLTGRIARAAGPLIGVRVIEVGPGPGGLTRALLAEGAQVTAIERDTRCLAALSEIATHCPGRLEVLARDALDLDYAAFASPGHSTRICANLPYNIATPLLVGWLESEPWPPWFDRLILMFQREVAERIVATPEQRAAYGRLAVLANWRCTTRILFDVPRQSFVPPPNVTSSVVELVPREAPLPCDARALGRVTQAAFGQRRKMLRQSLRTLGVDPLPLLDAAGIAPSRRAEEVPVEGFVALTQAFTPTVRPFNTRTQTSDRRLSTQHSGKTHMIDDKDDLPSDAEKGGLKPQTPKEGDPPPSTPDTKKEEQDPSEQPS